MNLQRLEPPETKCNFQAELRKFVVLAPQLGCRLGNKYLVTAAVRLKGITACPTPLSPLVWKMGAAEQGKGNHNFVILQN